MIYDFDKRIDRRGTYSIQWDCTSVFQPGAEESGKELICLSTADMDFECADSIRQEIQKVVDRNLYGYSGVFQSVPAHKPYFDAITGWYERRHNWKIDPESIIYSAGTVLAIKNAILAFSEEGDGVLINPPIYSPFASTIEETKRKVVRSPLINTDGYYTVDFADFEEKAKDPSTKVFILCNPHNPTGRVWTKEELTRMYDICTANGVVVVTDEVHGELTRRDQTFHPLGALVDGQNLMACEAPNKTFNIADLKATSVIIPNPDLRKKFQDVIGFSMPTSFTIAATIGAYNGGEEWLEQVREYLDGTFDWIVSFVAENMPRLKLRRPEGSYILWMDFRGYGLTPDEVDDRILKKAGVVLARGESFDEETGAGFQRICVPAPRAVIQEAFYRLKEVFGR